MAPVGILVGLQWGDEGKGKIADLMAQRSSVVVRLNGGPNAGHSVESVEGSFKVHQIPPGFLNYTAELVIAPGSVVDPCKLVAEIERINEEASIDVWEHLWISERAHLILPQHLEQDANEEDERREQQLGTTRTGNGPAYSDKYARTGHTIGEAVDHPSRYPAFYAEALLQLAPHVEDTTKLLHEWRGRGERILLVTAHGTMLDIDHGTYPYVTSSHCTSAGALVGTGLPPQAAGPIVGVAKAYTTRVAPGPMRSECPHTIAKRIREAGAEYGTTTGRPRRIGWLDVGQLEYACRVNGVTEIALTKLDVLGGLGRIRVATGDYRSTPSWQEFTGWDEGAIGPHIQFRGNLPSPAQDIIELIEDRCGAPVTLIGTGPSRDAIIRNGVTEW